jgi:hypothetical protein
MPLIWCPLSQRISEHRGHAALAPSLGPVRRFRVASNAAAAILRMAGGFAGSRKSMDTSGAPKSAWGNTAFRNSRMGYRWLRRRLVKPPRRQAMPLSPALQNHPLSAGRRCSSTLRLSNESARRTPLPPSGFWWRGLDCSVGRGGAWARRRAVPSVAGMGELAASSRSTTGAGSSVTASNRGT